MGLLHSPFNKIVATSDVTLSILFSARQEYPPLLSGVTAKVMFGTGSKSSLGIPLNSHVMFGRGTPATTQER